MKIAKVLIIDDDQDIQAVAKMALQTIAGWEVETVTDPKNATRVFADYDPDVVLLDWMMPEMTGIEVYQAIRASKRFDGTPVIFMTAKVQHNDRQTIADLGAQLISKPFDPMQLAEQVQNAVDCNLENAA